MTPWALVALFIGSAHGNEPKGSDRMSVQRASTRIKAAIVRRDRAEAQVRERGGDCASLAQANAEVDAAWASLEAAWRAAPSHTMRQGSALGTIATERAQDSKHAQVLADWCAGLAPVEQIPTPAPADPVALAPGMRAHEGLLEVEVPAGWPKQATDARDLINRVAAVVADDWVLVLVLVEAGVTPERALPASMAIERGIKGLGERAPWRAEHVPDWQNLHGVAVLDGAAGLARAATLRGIVAVYGNRLARPGCAPAAAGGWGLSDVGGQLGGGKPGTLIREGDRWRVEPLVGDTVGLSANGANSVPYAPIEQYLMGLLEPAQVPDRRQLKAPKAEGDAFVAEGTCPLDGASLVNDFGRRPRRTEPLTVGLIVATEAPLSAARVREHRRAATAFFAAGPDDDPFSYNFHEATQGHGRLLLVPPRLRAP